MIDLAVAAVLMIVVFIAGVLKGRGSDKLKQKEKELDRAKEVLEVRRSDSLDAALERLRRNGKLNSVQPAPTEHQLRLPL
jgi:hypothetical protein